jgi:hypothetical protein
MNKITHAGVLNLKGYEIPCYVTEDETRIISSRRMQVALGVTPETTSSGGQVPGKRLDRFFSQKSLKPLFPIEKEPSLWTPIRAKWQGKTVVGYNAELLPEICDVMLKARREGLLKYSRQRMIADQCEILLSAFARVGLIALIDEATGYQYTRAKEALVKILEKFISKELLKWVKTFPDEFYKLMFSLKGWRFNPLSVKRPIVVGRLTNNLVYERLAPGVLTELRRLNPKTEKGTRPHRHHQWLTEDIGHPKLREHLASLISLMRAAANWADFYRMVQRALPRYGDLPLIEYGERQAQEREAKKQQEKTATS